MYDPAYIIALFESLSADAQQEILDLAARRLALPGREVMSMVTYGELFAYTLVLIGVATLVFQMCKRK